MNYQDLGTNLNENVFLIFMQSTKKKILIQDVKVVEKNTWMWKGTDNSIESWKKR